MATCSLGGVADLKLFSFQSELSKTRHDGLITSCKMKSSTLESFCGLRGVRMVHRPVHAAGFNRQPWRLTNSLAVGCSSDGKEDGMENANLEQKSSTKDQILPGSFMVQSLLTTICDTTSIAEVELKKQQVKEGQVLCYVEQLGGEIPIESDVSGEVIKILRTDGEPVGYGDALIAILPSFPGIKKLQ